MVAFRSISFWRAPVVFYFFNVCVCVKEKEKGREGGALLCCRLQKRSNNFLQVFFLFHFKKCIRLSVHTEGLHVTFSFICALRRSCIGRLSLLRLQLYTKEVLPLLFCSIVELLSFAKLLCFLQRSYVLTTTAKQRGSFYMCRGFSSSLVVLES